MKKYKWVAQDRDGEIRTYLMKPDQLMVGWQACGNGCNFHSKGKPNRKWKESLIDLITL